MDLESMPEPFVVTYNKHDIVCVVLPADASGAIKVEELMKFMSDYELKYFVPDNNEFQFAK